MRLAILLCLLCFAETK